MAASPPSPMSPVEQERPEPSILTRFLDEIREIAKAVKRFRDPEMEEAYLGFAIPSLLFLSIASLVWAGLAFFINSIANVNPEPRPLVIVFCALTAVTGVFGIVCYFTKNRFNTPFHAEIQWAASSLCWILCETSVVDTRALIFCLDTLYTPPAALKIPPNLNVTVSPGIPSTPHYQQCLKVYIDCPQLFNPSVLFLFRFLWAAPITIIVLPICLHAFRFYYDRVVFERRDIIMYWWLNSLCFIYAVREHKRRNAFLQHREALEAMEQVQNARTNLKALLANVLAPSIVERLMRKETIYDQQRATVLYSDMAGFTSWSSKRRAPQVAHLLNEMFRAQDANLVKYGVEKVTTIGDAYWAACGIPTPQPLHAHRLCSFALQMQVETENLRRIPELAELHIRVGLDTGVVGGGIFGHQQFTYQVFGDTNEHAEIMEQLGPVDGVLISAATLAELHATQSQLPAGAQPATVSSEPGPTADSFVLLTAPWDPSMDEGVEQRVEEAVAATRMLALVEGEGGAGFNQVDMQEIRDTLEQPKYPKRFQPPLTFADDAVEADYWTYAEIDFREMYTGVALQMAAFFIVIMALVLGEGPYPQEWYVAVGFAVLAIIDIVSIFVYKKLPPLVAWMRFPLEFLIARILCVSINYRYSMISIHIHFLLFASGLTVMAFPPPRLNWVGGSILSLTLLCVGIDALIEIIVSQHMTSFLITGSIPATVFVVFFSFYTHEKSLRRQFIDNLSSERARERVLAEQATLTSLLSQSIPPFALPEIVGWLATDRALPISHAYPRAIVGFVRAPAVVHGLETGREMFDNITNLVDAYETVLSMPAFSNRVIKIKTIGDIMLLVTGHRFQSDESRSVSRVGSSRTRESGRSAKSYRTVQSHTAMDANSEQKDVAVFLCFGRTLEDYVRGNMKQSISMGIHIGSVAAAVVGDTRLIFDIFGDTVNTAARVMANCGGQGVWLSGWTTSVLHLGPNAIPNGVAAVEGPVIPITTEVGEVSLSLGPDVFKEMKGKGLVAINRVVQASLPETQVDVSAKPL